MGRGRDRRGSSASGCRNSRNGSTVNLSTSFRTVRHLRLGIRGSERLEVVSIRHKIRCRRRRVRRIAFETLRSEAILTRARIKVGGARVKKNASIAIFAVGEVSARDGLAHLGRRKVACTAISVGCTIRCGSRILPERESLSLTILGGKIVGLRVKVLRRDAHELRRHAIHGLGIQDRKHERVVGKSRRGDDSTCRKQLPDDVMVVASDSKHNRSTPRVDVYRAYINFSTQAKHPCHTPWADSRQSWHSPRVSNRSVPLLSNALTS